MCMIHHTKPYNAFDELTSDGSSNADTWIVIRFDELIVDP